MKFFPVAVSIMGLCFSALSWADVTTGLPGPSASDPVTKSQHDREKKTSPSSEPKAAPRKHNESSKSVIKENQRFAPDSSRKDS